MEKYNNLKVVFVDFPILSETLLSAAKACLAAFNQDVYFKYHSALLKSNKNLRIILIRFGQKFRFKYE